MRRSLCVLFAGIVCCGVASRAMAAELERVVVAKDARSFVTMPSGKPFVPWGFNYDHDETGRLLEDYWEREWPKVETDFRGIKQLGANVVRVHLQFGRFMNAVDKPNEAALRQLAKSLALAARTGLRLDLTGLGCYHKRDVPAWYDALDDAGRWRAQACFWEAVAGVCNESPAVFCYDLMNEPVVPGGARKPGDWLGPPFAGSCFVQCVTLDQRGRERPAIACEWTRTLAAAVRRCDRRHLITVGLVDWSLDRPGLTSGFVPETIAGDLDFISVHLYPKKGEVAAALETLHGFAIGKPVVIEETFPLNCPMTEFEEFMDQSRPLAAGWIGFYWGKPPAELRHSLELGDALTLGWLEYFQRHTKQ